MEMGVLSTVEPCPGVEARYHNPMALARADFHSGDRYDDRQRESLPEPLAEPAETGSRFRLMAKDSLVGRLPSTPFVNSIQQLEK